MQLDIPLSRDLVLIGGGHTHALVLRQWGMNPLAGARVTVINPAVTAPYTGMLPGYVAGHYQREELDIDLARLARFAGARLVLDEVIGIDRAERLVLLKRRPPIRYDIASINIGVTSALSSVPGFEANGVPAKPLGQFAASWECFVADVADSNRKADCVVVGGGVAGVELALAMAHRLEAIGAGAASVTILEARQGLLEGSASAARRILARHLERSGIVTITGVGPAEIEAESVRLSDGRTLPADFVVSAAGARPHAWVANTGLDLTDGYVDVDVHLRAPGDHRLFAAGDCANLVHAPRPKAGVFAVREAPVLYENLRNALAGKNPSRKYHPQGDYLKLISAGGKVAVAEKFGWAASAAAFWSVKNRIDKDFMERLTALPPMKVRELPVEHAALDEAVPADQMLCGGCGSKVSRQSLDAGLAASRAAIREDTVRGQGDDAAVLRIGDKLQVISTDHLRAFTPDPYTMAKIAAVHALGDIWAMGARPQSALVSLIIPHMSERMQADTVAEIMSAIGDVLREAGADLVGGHSSMGSEMTIGLTVTGLAGERLIGLEGAMPGDHLILTKPIGTGVILAADMRGMARGQLVQNALRSMMHPNAAASEILAPVAHAMTDVTGFGLAGHLMTILRASKARAHLQLDRVPCLEGAEPLASKGVKSSIWPANVRSVSGIVRPESARSDLLFDPQTAGGLLAAVSPSESDQIVAALAAAGETVSVIGHIEAGEPAISVA
jgi:selenide, water dikinase